MSLFLLILMVSTAHAQTAPSDSTYRRFFVGSSLFMLANLNTNQPNPPDFIQLNVGYRITPKDVVSIEAKIWKYAWPLDIPFGKSYLAPEEKCPVHVRTYGVALAYHMTHWPINTNVPESFARLERKWNTYFLFEPGLHLGVKF